jgi:hypothetical protein
MFQLSPRQLVKLGRQKVTELLLDAVGVLEAKGYAGSYISSILKSVRSWLQFNGVDATVKIKIKGASDSPTLVNERTPMQEELGRIFRGCNVVARACAALIAFSGVRPESLGDYTGMNGLVIGDFLEVELDNVAKRVTFKKTPTLVRVRKVISGPSILVAAEAKFLTHFCPNSHEQPPTYGSCID